MLDQKWEAMYKAAEQVQNDREITDCFEAGAVGAAVLSKSGKIYTGISVDTACSLGICAERNALFNMLTNGENQFTRVLALMPNGKIGAPCGACREFMAQLMKGKTDRVQVMLDYENEKIVTLAKLTPEWWL